MSSTYNFKKIQIVPNSSDFLDIILSKTQRKTPTVVHKSYAIGRIRQFYMRKVKFTQENFDEKLNAILHEFPILDSIHPFYADLMNILYDKDHYKLALGQINTAKHLINAVSKDYVKLLKFGDSLYRCKQLKKAALGRMATIMKRQKDSLAYLEQVRQHLSRLPSIDPNTRTLLLCGYPNVGKSSFINKITRADVDVQPYAFTTKSLFVGHMDYKYLRWQVIDTPGILDHPLEDRNTIEMQSITALAHLRACVLFFLDLSEQCGYTIEDQCALFNSIKPLFHNKPTLLVINKIDVKKLSDLSPSHRDYIDSLTNNSDVQLAQLSCFTDEGVMDVRNMACDKLLAARVEMKLKSQKVHDILNKLHLAQPQIRDDLPRLPFIPEGFLNKRLSSSNPDNKPKLERDHEAENGGAGVYNIDLKKKYMLEDSEWKYDKIPEIMNGKNVADFIDPEIEAKLEALEREEENLVNQGFYELDDNMENSEDEAIRSAASQIRAKKQVVQQLNRLKKGKNRAVLARKIIAQKSTSKELADHLSTLGLEANAAIQTATKKSQKRARSNSCGIDIARHSTSYPTAETDRSISRVRDRNELGLKDMKAKEFVESISRKAQRTNNLLAKRGEADRQIQVKRPKHLFAGKRKSGKTDRR